MRWPATVLAVLIAAVFAFFAWHRWDSAKNRGFTFGYYGEFNTVGNALSEIPGITVSGDGGNDDITFEDYMYNTKTADGNELVLWFAEREPIRTMSGRTLKDALLKKIEEESSTKQLLGNEN